MARQESLLVKCRHLLPCATCSIVEDTYMLVEDGFIQGLYNTPPAGTKTGRVIECPPDTILTPCLYNAHVHSVDAAFMGMLEALDYDKSKTVILRLWAQMPRDVAYKAAKMTVYKSVVGGSCGFIDMSPFPEEVARVAQEVGVRAMVGEVFAGEFDENKAFSSALSTIARLSSESSGLVRGAVSIYDVRMLELDKLRYIVSRATENGLTVQIHVSETRREVYEVKKRTGLFPVELLDKNGLLTRNVILVNPGWIASWEIEAVKHNGATIVLSPSTSMRMASAGHVPLKELIAYNIRVGLGSDSPAMSLNTDVLAEARHAILLYSYTYWDTSIKPENLLEIVQSNNASILLGSRGGYLGEGAIADFSILALEKRVPWRGSVAGRLVYFGATSLYTVVNGVIVFDHESDREKVEAEIDRLAEDLSSFTIEADMLGETFTPCFPKTAC